jgi:hypothetical protein
MRAVLSVMRHVIVCAVLAALSISAQPPSAPPRSRVTLLLQFEGQRSDSAVEEMKRELNSIMSSAGLAFDYKLRSELNEWDAPSDLIVVKFKGRCRMEAMPALFDERGPFAITHTVDGEIIPFSEVACDRVRVSIRSAMDGDDLKQADVLLGRALGRVVAHEIYHIVAKTPGHGTKGVARTSLSAAQLIAADLAFDGTDLEKFH